MPLGPEDIGVGALGAAAMLAAVRTIDYLVRQKSSKNGQQPKEPLVVPLCRAQCDAPDVLDRLREYHIENRQILQDIRDGIKLLAVLYREKSIERSKEPRGD